VDEGFEIEMVFVEAAYIALARILERALRSALPAPVERRYREAARTQVAHGLEILLDELGSALEQADRALLSRRRRPARIAQLDAVGRLERATNDVLGHWVGGDGDEGHGLIGSRSPHGLTAADASAQRMIRDAAAAVGDGVAADRGRRNREPVSLKE